MPDVGKAVTRHELYDAVYRKVGLSRTESSAFVELVLEEIKDSIARGEAVKLSSFGTFTVRKKGRRMGRNPKTGVDVPISPRRVVVFKASAIMKQRINGGRPSERKSASDQQNRKRRLYPEVDHPALTIAGQAVLRKWKNLLSKFCYFAWVNWLHALGGEVNG